MNWLEQDKANVWHPFTPLIGAEDPVVINSASGIYLQTEDGRRIIDGISSWWVNLHGHSHPAIADAIYRQAQVLEHVIFAGFTHPPAIKLAGQLLSILPKNQGKIFYSDNGSTAVEVAIKMALQYWHNLGQPRKRIIALEGAYHGDTFGSMSVGSRGLFTAPFSDHLFEVDFIPAPDGTNDNQVVELFRNLAKTGEVAAFIYEPLVQAAAGMRIFPAASLDKILALARSFEIPCISDEVFTGFGRTGKAFASDYLLHQPDIIALSKGLTGGTMALGVTSCCEKIHSAFQSSEMSKAFLHGHSFTANPIACAAASASFELFMSAGCQDNIMDISESHRQFAATIEKEEAVQSVRTLGTVLAMDVRTAAKTDYQNKLRMKIYKYFLERDILLRPLGNVIYFLPSYAFTPAELDKVYKAILDFARSNPSEGD